MMSYEQAQKILDRVREGWDYPEATIRRCLFLTGDLESHEELRGPGVDGPVQEEDWRGRCRSRQILVAAGLR